jgi:hypothetical protein
VKKEALLRVAFRMARRDPSALSPATRQRPLSSLSANRTLPCLATCEDPCILLILTKGSK